MMRPIGIPTTLFRWLFSGASNDLIAGKTSLKEMPAKFHNDRARFRILGSLQTELILDPTCKI